jgi:hypothetical protein
MAYQVAVRQDEAVRVRLRDENSEVRRDEAAHPMVASPDELEIFGLATKDRRRDAASPNLFLKLMRDFPLELPRQVAATQEHPADRAQEV